jgi:hypothetical protein
MMREKKKIRHGNLSLVMSKLNIVAEKEKRRIELGLPDPKAEPIDTFNHNFIQRPMLLIPGVQEVGDDSKKVTIMTYNVLAQSLIRRRLFPFSGSSSSSLD